jgi:hypothetical protein
MSKSGKWVAGNISYLYSKQRERYMGLLNVYHFRNGEKGNEQEVLAVNWIRENLFMPDLRHCDVDFDDKLLFERPELGYVFSPDTINDERTLIIEIKTCLSEETCSFFFSPTIPYEKKRARVMEEHGYQIAGQFMGLESVSEVWIMKWDAFDETNETDERELDDPRRGIVFKFTRNEFLGRISDVEERVSFANWLLDSGHDPGEAQELWDKAHSKPVE